MTHSNNMSREDEGVAALIRAAFDSDSVPQKNIALRKAYDQIEELTEQNRRVKLVMGGALTMLAGYDADAANELRAALNEGDA